MENDLNHAGLICFINDDLRTAADNFTRALDKSVTIDSLVYRGTAYLKLGEYTKAIIDFDKAQEIEARFDVFYNRAKARFYDLDFEKAKEDLKNALESKDVNDERKELASNLLAKINK